MTTPKDRKAKERKAKREAGFVRIEAWVPAHKAEYIKRAIAEMVDPDAARKAMVEKMVLLGWPEHVAKGVVANIAHESVWFRGGEGSEPQ